MKTTYKNYTTNQLNSSGCLKMKLSLTLLLSFVFITSLTRASTNFHLKYDSTSCLVIEGKILNENEGPEEDCKIELIAFNSAIDSVILKDGKRKFRFVLSKNMNYAIRISKKGYVSKLVGIDTEILTDEAAIFKFNFSTSLIKEEIAKKLNHETLDWPVALIYFDYDQNCFSYDKQYTRQIKRALYTVNAGKSNTYN